MTHHGSPPVFACGDVALVRAAARPPEPGGPQGEPAVAVPDEALREALAVSSPTLSATLDRIAAGEPVPARQLRRAQRALQRYRLRMTGRATPFGLLAGVATAGFGEPRVSWGDGHRRTATADHAWVSGLTAALEARPEVVRVLRATANDLCFVRGDRIVVPYPGDRAGSDRRAQEISLRLTGPVRLVLEAAAHPVPVAGLADLLARRYPAVPAATLDRLLGQLVVNGVLLTELRRPLDDGDPLDHLLARLTPHAERLPADVRERLDTLRTVRAGLDAYAATPPGHGRAALEAVRDRMARAHPGDHLVKVDLRLDLHVTLPEQVRAEAERAAGTLWAVSAVEPPPAFLAQYHGDFLERYGTGRAVPLAELLNPATGLGAPAGYEVPASPRRLRHEPPPLPEEDAVLLALAQEASLAGEREVLLDDATLTRLTRRDPAPLTSFDLLTHLLAPSLPALRDGDFRLAVLATQTLAGAYTGRFATLLGADGERVGDLVRSLPTLDPEAFRAHLVFPARTSRVGNVTGVPRWSGHRIVVGGHTDADEPGTLRMPDLAVVALPERLAVISAASGREVVPTLPHMAATDWHAPNAARFLADVTRSGEAGRPRWRWGAADALVYLPRVRRGRVILASARWRVTAPELREGGDPARWLDRFGTWRERWRVPRHVQAASGDRRVTLDLEDADHLDLLRNELIRDPAAHLTELPAGGEYGTGWLSGAPGDPGRACEIAFSLVRRAPHPAPTPVPTPAPTPTPVPIPTPAPAPVPPARRLRPPGTDWLYAKVYCPAETQDHVITRCLPELIASAGGAADRWFYLRYRDDDGAHLRLRLHGRPGDLAALLPDLGAWALGLADQGLGGRLVLDTYDPETERYGGTPAMEAAERLFHADSLACLEQIPLRTALDPPVLAAAGYADLAVRMLGEEQAAAWFLDRPQAPSTTPLPRANPRLIDPLDERTALKETEGGPELLAIWERRAPAATAYADTLRTLHGPAGPGRALASVLHLHHNRLLGIDRDAETTALRLARAAFLARRATRDQR